MQYEVKFGQTIYDVAVIVYGSPQYAVKLSVDNGIDITDSIVGLSLYFNETIKPNVVASAIIQSEIISTPNNNYFVKSLQSTYDLCLQFGFGLDRYVEFVFTTNMSFLNIDESGTTIVVTQQNRNLPNNLNFATQIVYDNIAQVTEYLLQEDNFYLLQENLDKIIIT
jgi:hypothetical protein